MTKQTYSVYIIEKSGEWVHWSVEQSYQDAVNEAAWQHKYEGREAVVIEDQR